MQNKTTNNNTSLALRSYIIPYINAFVQYNEHTPGSETVNLISIRMYCPQNMCLTCHRGVLATSARTCPLNLPQLASEDDFQPVLGVWCTLYTIQRTPYTVWLLVLVAASLWLAAASGRRLDTGQDRLLSPASQNSSDCSVHGEIPLLAVQCPHGENQ